MSLNERVNVCVFCAQRLEESVLSEEKRLTVRGPSPDAPPTCLPARVREIVTKNLSDSCEWPRIASPSYQNKPSSLPYRGLLSLFHLGSGGHVLGHVPPGGEPSAAGRARQAGGSAGPQQSRPR